MKKEKTKDKIPGEKNKKLLDMQSINLSREQKFWIGTATVILVLLTLTFIVYMLNNELFDNNKHFTISKVYIETHGTTGYWNNPQESGLRETELARELEIEEGKDNLFAQDLEQKRKDLLEGHPEMKEVHLFPVLPDHLKIRIVERLPIARLDPVGTNDAKLIDKDGFIFSAKYFPAAASLPYIADEYRSEQLIPGGKVQGDGLKFLMQFLNIMKEKDIQFHVVSAKIVYVNQPDNYGHCIKAHLKKDRYENETIYFPCDNTYSLEKLRKQCLVLKRHAIELNRPEKKDFCVYEKSNEGGSR